jgi:4-diphosphocytidyl-2-C-methyl-D-erythritol kinase
MRETTEKAYAKLNLSLDVTGKRADGYHELVMLMQTVTLCDTLSLRLRDDGKVSASSNLRYIPGDERNLAVRAALRYREAVGEPGQGLQIDIRKEIPVGAGMAGGSADAAAVLRALDRLYGFPLGRAGLERLAQQVGSDVAFCVAGGTALAKGRGELLEDLTPMPDCYFVLCKPSFSISTPELFRKLDAAPVRHHPDTAGLLEAVHAGDLRGLCRRMYNVFEDVDDRRLRAVAEIKGRLLDHRALGAIMTGTGSAVFGVFERAEDAESACQALRSEYKLCCTARPVPRLPDGSQPGGGV